MNRGPQIRTVLLFLLLIAMILGLSLVSNHLWESRPETLPEVKALVIHGQIENLTRMLLLS